MTLVQFLHCLLRVHHHLHDSQQVHGHLQAADLPKDQHIEECQDLHWPLLYMQRPPTHPRQLSVHGRLQRLQPFQHVHWPELQHQ